jgi:hypothetical protein
VTCSSPESIVQEVVIHFGSIEWAGKAKRSLDDEQIVREAQIHYGIEGTWNVRESVVANDVRIIETVKTESIIDKPDLPKDANVTFNYGGTCKTVALKAGATAAQQAQAAQKAFNVTLECGPIEEDGGGYVVHVFKPSVFPVTFVRDGNRTRSWVHNTSTKVIQGEAQRLFGGDPTVELLNEPGLVYEVKSANHRVKKPKQKPESNTRQMTGPGIKAVVPPSISSRRATSRPAISQRSLDGRDIVATGSDRTTGPRGVDIHVIFPQKTQTIKNVVLLRTATKDEIANLIQRQLRTDPLNSDFIEFAPENWFETRELYARFRYVRQDITALDLVEPQDFKRTMDFTIPFFIETDGACSGNPGPGGWGFVISQGTTRVEVYGAEGHTSNNEMELRAIDEALKFLGNARGYAVIESDSQGCLDMMLER